MRNYGILLHITSLPSDYGIGDLGPEAYRFADFLHGSGASVWQVLPLTPIDPDAGGSPYNSASAFAGSNLLISPDLLRDWGYLKEEDLAKVPSGPKVDFRKVNVSKLEMLEKAFQNFKPTNDHKHFCQDNSHWLDDYARFVSYKKHFKGVSWTLWPNEIRDRIPAALEELDRQTVGQQDRIKFQQFMFHSQWKDLKRYCSERNIKLFGDMPIYVDHESADVWTQRELWKLDKLGKPKAVSGVPPDYFSKTGQLWGNPVYDWKAHKKEDFSWWNRRIGRSLKLFDIVRIDHFRAFSQYWEVAAGEKTAINGKWVDSPGKQLFNRLLKALPDLPLVAEDLGYITDDVKELMKRFGLPGMKILMFAWGGGPENTYLPHNIDENYYVYTGTHDNNTVRGWFQKDASREVKEHLEQYAGTKITSANVHKVLTRLAMASRARTCIIPLQDILGLGGACRMNTPSKPKGNWGWRTLPDSFGQKETEYLKDLAETYGRL